MCLIITRMHLSDGEGREGDLDCINSILTNIKSALLLETYKISSATILLIIIILLTSIGQINTYDINHVNHVSPH